jgi:hypothetical protein
MKEDTVLKPVVFAVAASAMLSVATIAAVVPSQALTMQECSAKYKAAQAAGSQLKWNDFRKAECSADAAATPTAAPAPTTAAPAKPAAKPAETPKPAAASAPVGNAVFPTAVAPKYSKETEGKARMHTCLDQYNANKATNANGGLNWIQKGGGYYSECNKRLKG